MKIGLQNSFNKQDLFLFSTVLVAVTLSYSVRLNSVAIILLVLSWVFTGNRDQKIFLLKRNKLAWVFILFYLYIASSFIWGSASRDWSFDLEKKISMVLLPIMFASSVQMQTLKIEKVLNFFVVSCLGASTVCFAIASIHYVKGDPSYLFYHKLGSPLGLHAVYFSLYVGFAFFIALNKTIRSWYQLSAQSKLVYLLIEFFFIFFLVLLSSKTMVVAVISLTLLVLATLIINRWGRIYGIGIFVLLVICFVLLVIGSPNIKERFGELFDDGRNQSSPLVIDNYQGYHFTGGTIRLAIWKICFEIVDHEKAWIKGIGTGRTQHVLTENYISRNIYPGDSDHVGFIDYNAHNQYLQFLVSLGLIGLLWFIAVLGICFSLALRTGDLVLLSFVWLFSLFSITESTLQVQKGIVFFSFFVSVLVINRIEGDRRV